MDRKTKQSFRYTVADYQDCRVTKYSKSVWSSFYIICKPLSLIIGFEFTSAIRWASRLSVIIIYLQSLRAFYSNTGQVRILHNVECISQVSVRSIEHVRTKRTGTENNRRVQRHLKKREPLFCLYRRLDIRIMHACFWQLLNFRDFVNIRISIL